MYAMVETADAINLFHNDTIISTYTFRDNKHAHKTYRSLIRGRIPSGVRRFLRDNQVDKLIVDRSMARQTSVRGIELCEDQDRLRMLRERVKVRAESVRGLSHVMAHANVNVCTADPVIVNSYLLLKQVESDMERYDKRALEIYMNYLPELRIRKRHGDEKMPMGGPVEYKDEYDVEVIRKLWNIRESSDVPYEYQWTRYSVGTSLSAADWANLGSLISLIETKRESRDRLLGYLSDVVERHAPNVCALVGHRMAAELIVLSGSLLNLAKCSAGTVQLLGAEKALFKALKQKTPTPKYGVLRENGMSRSARVVRALASKIVICARIDTFSKHRTDEYGKELRRAIETKIKGGDSVHTDVILKRVSKRIRQK